jgi:hypothetical protein
MTIILLIIYYYMYIFIYHIKMILLPIRLIYLKDVNVFKIWVHVI